MHNRRSTTTCFRLTMVALKLFIPRHRMHKDNSYRLTMVALKLLTIVEKLSDLICICYRLTMVALKPGWSAWSSVSLTLSYRLTMVALKQSSNAAITKVDLD